MTRPSGKWQLFLTDLISFHTIYLELIHIRSVDKVSIAKRQLISHLFQSAIVV